MNAIRYLVAVAWIGIAAFAFSDERLSDQAIAGSPETCDTVYPPYPDPFPPLLPPDDTLTTFSLERVIIGENLFVGEGDSIQEAIDLAQEGDIIIVGDLSVSESVVIDKSGIRIRASIGRDITWKGESNFNAPYNGIPAITITSDADVIIHGITIEGGDGVAFGIFGGRGGDGAPAILVEGNARAYAARCELIGGDGGDGAMTDTCGGVGHGGDGAPAVLATGTSKIWVDLESSLTGGAAGMSPMTEDFFMIGVECCVHGAPHGSHGMPLGLEDTATFEWAKFFGLPDLCKNDYGVYPDPFPPMLPPYDGTTSFTLTTPTGATLIVNAGESIQDAIDAAQPGDTILVADSPVRESVVINKSGLTIRAAPRWNVVWRGEFNTIYPYHGFPAITLNSGAEVVIDSLILKGGSGTRGIFDIFGGEGGPAILLNGNARAYVARCQIIGGPGSSGNYADACGGWAGVGGNGGPAVLAGGTSQIWGDLNSSFLGGDAGRSGQERDLGGAGCCFHGAPHGNHGIPLELNDNAAFEWAEIFGLPLNTSVPAKSWKSYD